MHHLDSKILEMKSKYNMNFEDFKRRIEVRKENEVFEEWDDFIIWDAYESAKSYWLNVVGKLSRNQG